MAKAKAKAKASKGKAKPAKKAAPAKKGAKPAKKAAGKTASKPAKKAAAKPAKKPAAKAKAKAKPTTKAKAAIPAAKAAKAATPTATNGAPAKSATKTASDAYSAAIDAGAAPPANGEVSLGTLRLENYRKPFAGPEDALSEAEKAQLSAVVGADTLPTLFGASDESENEMAWLEYMDVVDTKSGSIVANLLIWPYGDGAVVHHGTTKMIASIVQHGINPHETTGKAWMADFAKAWEEGAPRLGVSSPNHFGFDSEQSADADDE